ncbi:hypothetical protein ACWGII_41280 [Streptomyces sp. NPDC054855]
MTTHSYDAAPFRPFLDALAELGELLDVEAGLQEILMQSGHDSRVTDLHSVLDEEAGLTQILNPEAEQSPAPPASRPEQNTDPAAPLVFYNIEFPHFISASERLRLRTPTITALVEFLDEVLGVKHRLSQLLVQLDSPHRTLHADRGALIGLVQTLTKHTRRLLGPDAAQLIHMQQAAETLGTAFVRSREAARAGKLSVPAFNRAMIDTVRSALHLANRAVQYAHPTDGRLHGAIPPSYLEMQAKSFLRSAQRVRDAVHNPPAEDTTVRSSPLREAATEAGELCTQCVLSVRGEIEMRLEKPLPPLPWNAYQFLLDDFTTADLTTADLRNVDLTGVRWTETGTRWPAAVSTETLKSISEETPQGSGIYVIRDITTLLNLTDAP